MEEPSDLSDDEVNEADEETDGKELVETYELYKKAKQTAKKASRSYKDSHLRVREIKKDRQPYMPVAAISPGGHLPTDNLPAQPTFKYTTRKMPRKVARVDAASKKLILFVAKLCPSSPMPRRRKRTLRRLKS